MLDFSGQVVIVTGAGNGLGRRYALDFARRGARVVVNDIGVGVDGAANGDSPAERVVSEVRAAGGEAVAAEASVASAGGGKSIVDAAVSAYGRVDVLVNNAGIARTNHFTDVRVNAIAPVAQSRMAADVYGRLNDKLDPAFVSTVVLALAHPSSTVTGEVISAGGGRISRLLLAATEGHFDPALDDEQAATVLSDVAADERVAAVPGCAMDEIDLIRGSYPDLADFRMAPR